MKFREYELFNRYLKIVPAEIFYEAAVKAKYYDEKFIEKMYKEFKVDGPKFLIDNQEGIMFEHFKNEMYDSNFK